MASFNFTVDTKPMANEIKSVSNHVNAVSGSVIAMQTAVVKAEKEGADRVCRDVNRGFYSLMQSQITQKIASLTSQVEAKLMDLRQQSIALLAIQNRMERDYNMISRRYTKLFGTLNNSLYKRIQELDKPLISLVHSDARINDNRIKGLVASISTNQNESILKSQLILTSKTKNDGAEAIGSIHQFIRDVNLQKQQSSAVISNIRVKNESSQFLPVSITESTNEIGASTVKYFVPTSNIGNIDEIISKSARQSAIDAVHSGNWQPIGAKDKHSLDNEFSAIIASSALDERVKGEIARMYNEASDVRQLKHSKL